MCGIFGHTSFIKGRIDKSRKALHTLTHRGPDQWGEWWNDKVYIGHRRLSILDLSEQGKQPMVDKDQEVVIAVNGEIYNYVKLKKELSGKYHFKSQSDSEVILYGYKEWGINGLLERIDGMYAFCIIDNIIHKIFLARDRAGIKPLYYACIGDTIAWASELKALENFFSDGALIIDKTAPYDFLTYLYVPTPKTLYQNVFKLEPAHFLEIDHNLNRIKKHQYWKLKVGGRTMTPEHAADELRGLIKKSVREQMMSDVPVGFFLSGGMDSSTVTAEASNLSKQIQTYSIGFNEISHDETHFAERVALHFNTYHEKKILDKFSLAGMFNKLKVWYDEPFGDTSAFPTFFVSKFAKERSTVVLTGDGGDEVFGGYRWYARFKKINGRKWPLAKYIKPAITRVKNGMRMRLIGKMAGKIEFNFLLEDLELYTKLMGGMLKDEKKSYALMWDIPKDYDDYWYFRKYYRQDLEILTRLQYLDFHTYLPDDILTKVDRVSMAVSLEARVPLLSREIIEFSFSIPEDVRYLGGKLKGLMKLAYRDILPAEIIQRGKKGFSIPVQDWEKECCSDHETRQEYIIRKLFAQVV